MMWFTADTHFGHSNILGGNQRPFDSLPQMEQRLIANINDRVSATDQLYVLGDFSYRATMEQIYKLRRRIVCQNVHLIRGNHDKEWSESEYADCFASEQDYLEIKPGFANGHKLVLFHYPIVSWNGKRRGSIQLHGHIHSHGDEYNVRNRERGILRYDVGVDANDYCPVSRDHILDFFADELKNY